MKRILGIIAFLTVSVFIFAGEPFYFIQITDTHFGYEENLTRKQQSKHFDKIKDFTKAINGLSINPEFVVLTGDIENEHPINKESFDKSIELLKSIKYPLYFIPGNHDINPKKPEIMESSASDFVKNFGAYNYSKEVKGVHFIFMYDEALRTGTKLQGYNELEWLESELKKAQGKPVILFMHSPPGGIMEDGKVTTYWNGEAEKNFDNMVDKYKVKAIIAGHEHSANMTYAGDIPVYIAPSFIEFDNGTYKYRVFQYDNNKLSYFTNEIK